MPSKKIIVLTGILVVAIVVSLSTYTILMKSDTKTPTSTLTTTIAINLTKTLIQTTTTTATMTITLTTLITTPVATPTQTITTTPTTIPRTTPITAYTPRTSLKGLSIGGAGASFQYPQIALWARLFQEATGAEVTYQSVGSGAGQRMFLSDRVVDFAASDPPLTKEQYEKYKGQVMQIPWIMGAVVVVYNIPEVKDYNLRLTAEVIARVYKGEIEYWDDQAIRELNPGIADKLPHKQIIAVHRSDSSGTTEIFTTFLNKASPSTWTKDLVGKVVDWPVDRTGRGIGAKGNEGVTATVVQTPYSIGYIELSYAIESKLPVAAVMNSAGKFVMPTEETIRNAAVGIAIPSSPLDDFSATFYEVVYSSNPDSYPIASLVYVILWNRYQDRGKALALSEFLRWIALEGYKNMVTGYVRPPNEVVELLLKASSILVESS